MTATDAEVANTRDHSFYREAVGERRRARSAALDLRVAILARSKAEADPLLAAAGMFADDPFADEVDAHIAAVRQREREEAEREATA